jgi:hypothetical protein
VIVRHQRESTSNRGFRYLARYFRGRDTKPRATWFLAAKLPGVSGADDLKLACRLVDAAQAQNTRAGSKRTYHLVISLHPEDRCLEPDELQQIQHDPPRDLADSLARRILEDLCEALPTLGVLHSEWVA